LLLLRAQVHQAAPAPRRGARRRTRHGVAVLALLVVLEEAQPRLNRCYTDPMAILHGKGHLKGAPNPYARSVNRLLMGTMIGAGEAPLPDSVDWSFKVASVNDQGQTSTCVWQFISKAIELRAAVLGDVVRPPSVLAGYTRTRQRMRMGPGPLTDEGCVVSVAVSVLHDCGVVAEPAWPFSEANVNVEPPWDVVQAEAEHKVPGAYSVDAPCSGRATQLRIALAAGYVPGIAIQVNQAFEDYAGQDIILPGPKSTDVILGGHMLTVVGYEPGAFKILNSWGTSWGRSGYVWLAESFITDDVYCSDATVLEDKVAA